MSEPCDDSERSGGAAGKRSPCTAEKLQPAFSNSSARSSLISPPPPPGRAQEVRRNRAPPPSKSSRPETMRSRSSRKRSSICERKAVMRAPSHANGACRGAAPSGTTAPARLLLARRYRGADLGGKVLGLLLQALA